jgi:hypothetical protein
MRALVRLPLLGTILCAALIAPTQAPARADGGVGAAPATGAFHYRVVPLGGDLPGDSFFDVAGIAADGRVFGTAVSCDDVVCPHDQVAVSRDGRTTLLRGGFAVTVNDLGLVGGGVFADPAAEAQGVTQAALFLRDRVRVVPRLPGEVSSLVLGVTNLGTALIGSSSETGVAYYLYDARGRVTPLDLGPDQILTISVNDASIVVGTIIPRGAPARAFRYNPATRALTKFDPVEGDPESWGMAINLRGDVLGYSFVSGGRERIGVWRGRTFQPYFVEGTPEFPTISNRLLWNRRDLIVITATNDGNSYLVPRPGVRLRLADLVDGPLPPVTQIVSLNDRGDLVGFGGARPGVIDSQFLLERVG